MLLSLKRFSHALVFVWILAAMACACQEEFKGIGEQITILCSSSPDDDQITWNFTQANSVVISQDGRSIMIPPYDTSVYTNYSCFNANGTLINCYSVYISGIYSWLCPGLCYINE